MSRFSAIIKYWEMSKKQLGDAGERVVQAALHHAGFQCGIKHERKCGDLRVYIPDAGQEIFKVEVKTARRSKNGNFQFVLEKDDKYGATTHTNCDYVILLCVLESGFPVPFVVPCSALRGIKKIELTKNILSYSGKYKPYRREIGRMML